MADLRSTRQSWPVTIDADLFDVISVVPEHKSGWVNAALAYYLLGEKRSVERLKRSKGGKAKAQPKSRRSGKKRRMPLHCYIEHDVFIRAEEFCERYGLDRSRLTNRALAVFIHISNKGLRGHVRG